MRLNWQQAAMGCPLFRQRPLRAYQSKPPALPEVFDFDFEFTGLVMNKVTDQLIIFSRFPAPGKVKTRLIPFLGPVGAADLQRQMTESILQTAKRFSGNRNLRVDLCVDGGDEGRIRTWLGRDVCVSFQTRGDLGERMGNAFKAAFQKGCRKVVLIGSDIPEMDVPYLEKAFDLLNQHDLVVGPVIDGGYGLIGMKASHDIFEGVPWGSDRVLEQTLGNAKTMGIRTALLDPLADIDTFDDLKGWNFQKARKRIYVSVIIPTFNEESNICAAVSGSLDDEAEVIVVDGGSSDRTVQKAASAGARVETCSKGRWIQQNFGAGSARGKILLFLHADSCLPDRYTSHVFETFLDPQTLGGGFRFKTDWNRPLMRFVEKAVNFRSNVLKLPYGDQGLFFRRQFFEEMGGFPKVPIAEDLLMVQNVKRRGRIRIAPVSVVTSARRWRQKGILQTTLINQLIFIGSVLGIDPERLAGLYGGFTQEDG